MDTDNIASILKDALNASITQVQNESKHTKVFVLPSELLKGLLVKNELPKVDNTAKAGTSDSKNSKETTKNKKQSLENSKSTTLPVDLPKRTSNRQSATNQSPKNTRSQTPSKKKRASKNEQKQEQSTGLDDNETSDTSKSIAKITIPKRSYRGRKSKAKTESEPLELSNIETSIDTKSDKVQETIENNHDIQNFSINTVSDKPLDNSSLEKSAKISDEIEEKFRKNDHELHEIIKSETQEDSLAKSKTSSATILDKIEEKCAENDHEMQYLLTDDRILNNTVQENNLAKPRKSFVTISDEVEEKCTEKDHEMQDILTDEIFNNTVQEGNLLSTKNDDLSSEKNLCDETLEVADSKTEIIDQVLQDSHVEIAQSNTSQKVSNEVISVEVELHGGKENNVTSEPKHMSNDDETIIIEEETYIVEEIIEVIESDDDNSMPNESDKVNKVEDIVIKTEKDLPVEDVDFPEMINNLMHVKPEPTFEKDSINSEPIVEQIRPNNKKVYVNKRQNRSQSRTNAVQKKSARQINYKCNKNNLIDTTLKDTSLEKLFDESQSLAGIQEKPISKFNSHCVHEIIADIVATEASFTKSLDLKCSQKIQSKSNSETECDVDQKSLTDSLLIDTENPCQEKEFSQISLEHINSEIKGENDQTVLNTKLPERYNVNACEELKPKDTVSVLESNSTTDNINKTDKNKFLDSDGASVENLMYHTEHTGEIQTIDRIEKTNNTLENLENQKEHVEVKTPNRRSRRKSENANIEAQSNSKIRIKKIEVIVKGTAVVRDSTGITVNNDIEENIGVTDNENKTKISFDNNDLGTSTDFCKNENVSTIKSLRQLRNRIKVVPRVPTNLRKSRSNIEKESPHLKNDQKSDIVPKHDFDISNSIHSVSLDVESKIPEELYPSAKRISRKHKSVDNHLVNENRMSSLRRRSAILENETKLRPVSEDDDHKKSSDIKDCEKGATVKDSSYSKDLKDIVDSNSSGIDDFQNANIPVEKAIHEVKPSLKPEKVIVVRKIQKGRRSKSSQPKDNSTLTTNVEKKNDKGKDKETDLKITDNAVSSGTTVESNLIQMEDSKTAKNKDKIHDNLDGKLNDGALSAPICQMDMDTIENVSIVKSEKVITATRAKRGAHAKSTLSNEIAAENAKDIFDTKNNNDQLESADLRGTGATASSQKTDKNTNLPEVNLDNTFESSFIDTYCQMDNALKDSNLKIKSEKVTAVKKCKKERRSKFTSSNVASTENIDYNVDINKNSHELEIAGNLTDRDDAITTTDNKKIDENVVLPTDNTNEATECSSNETSNADFQAKSALDDDSFEIKTEKVSPCKRGRTRSRSKSTSSKLIPKNKNDNSDIIKSSHELKSVDDSNIREEVVIDDSTTICKEEASENTVLPTDNPDKTLESSIVDVSIKESSIDNAEAEIDSKIKSETVTPVTRGRIGKRPKAKPSVVNARTAKRNEDDRQDTKDDVSTEVAGDVPIAVTCVSNEIVASTLKDEEIAKVSDDFASSESSVKLKPPEKSSVKKGRRGRHPKNFQMNDSANEKEITSNDCTSSSVENNVDPENITGMEVEEADDDSIIEKSIDISMDVDSIAEENNVTQDDYLDTTGIDDETKEEPGERGSRLSRRISRHEKQETVTSNVSEIKEEPVKRGRRSTKIVAKRKRADSDDEPKEKDSGTMEARRSGRRQRSAVNYRVPDEDVDVVASEAQTRQKPSEKGPKKRRGRPSLAETLARNASAKKNLEPDLQESVKKELDTNVNDSDSASADVGNEPTRKRRATKSTINPDIFEVDSQPFASEKSLDVSDDLQQAESVSDAADDTHDFEDSHFSDKEENEDEDFVKQPKPGRRGKKRKRFNIYKPRKRGRPKKDDVEESEDDDYFPHHSHVPQPTKSKDKTKETPEKKVSKCGKCAKEVPRHQWYSHNLFSHNDMGWIEGTPKPDFENDQKLLMRVLTLAHKKKHKKGLVCEACREVKKSVVGFISHITFCGKTEEEMLSLLVTCEICGARFKPSSMEYHERQHRLEVDIKKKKEKEMAEKEQAVIDALEPRSKRKAAEKAVSKISEFTALVKDVDGPSVLKNMKFSSPIIKKFIQAPQTTKRISSFTIAKWNKDLGSNQDAACTQFGCTFTCKSLDEMKEHYSSCNFTPTQNYMCKICRYQTPFQDDIVQHVNEKHTHEDFDLNVNVSGGEASSDEDYSEVDEDSSNQGQVLVKKFFYKETTEVENKMFKFIFNNGMCYSINNKTFLPGFQWTLEFERKHFKFSIFDNFVPNTFTPLEGEDAKDYLPQLDQSMPARFAKKESPSEQSEWKNWSRFETTRIDDSPTFFVGGPIWAMAWAPTPSFLASSEDLPQFLAISTHPSMDSEYASGKSYSGKNIIQLWSVGKLNNRTMSEQDPELSYAIAHNGGTVWSLEWCPSGCYQHEDFTILKGENNSSRLGLLAAGCSDGCVRIYSLIFPQKLPPSSENQYPIYKTEPVATLVINTESYENNSATWQVLKICWSREANHNVIVAGFSNGYVAFWDLTTKSPFLKYQVDNTTFFRPYKLFFAHHHAVTMLALVPQDNKRYLATASLDRFFKFWDLEDISKPKNTFKRSYVTDGCWFNNWNCAVLAYDEALCMGHNISVSLPLRDYTYKHYNLLPSNSTTYAIATSDFGNSLATGNIAGELLTLFPHQIIYYREMERTIPPKRVHSLISTMELVDFKAGNTSPVKKDKRLKKVDQYKDPDDFMPSSYEESKDRFGIQFNCHMNAFDSNMKRPKKHPRKQTLTCENLEKVPIEQYPLKSINKVAWNPNASSFLWLATGYQSGFVRLFSFRAIASTPEWNRMLQSHTDALKSQMTEGTSEEDC